MRTFYYIVLILLALSRIKCHAQIYTNLIGIHDPSLDQINQNVGNVDADLNGYLPNLLTLNQLNTNGAAINKAYADNSTNVIAGALTGTNFQNASNAFTAFGGMSSNSFSVSGFSSNFDGSITENTTNDQIPLGSVNGHAFTMDLGGGFFNAFVPIFQGVGFQLRTVILAIGAFLTMIELFTFLQKKFDEMYNSKQMLGSAQSALGVNASSLTGVAYAAIFTGLIVGLITFFTAYFLTGAGAPTVAQSVNLGSTVKTFTDQFSLWGIITTLLPISGLMTQTIIFLLFRFGLAFPLFMVIRAVILFLIV